jgi:Fe2+ or Zn2+ uptake regulation protein
VSDGQELDGIALRIYVALANADKPLGPREITRLVNLSSPSVAYRNLQKLEELGLIEKDAPEAQKSLWTPAPLNL